MVECKLVGQESEACVSVQGGRKGFKRVCVSMHAGRKASEVCLSVHAGRKGSVANVSVIFTVIV